MKSLNDSSINMRCWYGFITLVRTIHHKFNYMYYSPIYKDLYDSSLIKKKTIRNTFPFFSWKLLTKSLNCFHNQTIIWHFFASSHLCLILMSSAEIMFITTELNFWWSVLRALQKFTRFSILSPLKWMIGIWLHVHVYQWSTSKNIFS